MKRSIELIVLLFLFPLCANSVRVITSFDIAKWYLNADVVIVCEVKNAKVDTLQHNDYLGADGWHSVSDLMQKKYVIQIDSIIKGSESPDTVYSPSFVSNFMKEREVKAFNGFDKKGDSIFRAEVEGIATASFDDFSYFSLDEYLPNVVILSKVNGRFVVDYCTVCSNGILSTLKEIKEKGEAYFNP